MSTATSEQAATNALFASAATTLAQFLIDHDGPECASATLDYLGASADVPRVLLHLSSPHRLSDLAGWAELLSEPTVMITRRPTSIAATVELVVDDIPFTLWSHLARDETTAVWNEIDLPPEVDESVRFSVDALRRAANGGA